jgi:Pregnancy-associated plasma protein-A/Secretion system C-terminal sorting domain
VGIEFCLAKTDPKGKATTGITRTQTSYATVWGTMGTSQSNPTPRRRIYYSILEGRDAWDTKKYLNIWVGRLGNGKAGYGSFPNATKPEDVDGIVVDPQFFGTVGTAANNAGYNQGRTAVHEVGHYLNLFHPWGTSVSNFDCNGDDFVADTPKQEEAVTNCPSTFVFHCGKKVMTMNFMNFVYDDCMSMFTLGQKTRMLDALMNYRADLLNSTACQSITALYNALNNNVLVYPNPARENVTIELKDIEKANYTLYDLAGRVVAQGDLQQHKNSINVADLAAGFYQLGLSNGHQITFKSLVIQ